MSVTLTVEGDCATVDARQPLTTQGSVAAPSLVIPSGMKKIDRIIVSASNDGGADGSGVVFLRLDGAGVMRGEQTLMVCANGIIANQAGGDGAPELMGPIVIEDVDIEVSASDTMTIHAEMAGSDLGTTYVVVTIVFA